MLPICGFSFFNFSFTGTLSLKSHLTLIELRGIMIACPSSLTSLLSRRNEAINEKLLCKLSTLHPSIAVTACQDAGYNLFLCREFLE